eukprot:15034492-Alexandrium_andersonii.AAC.1
MGLLDTGVLALEPTNVMESQSSLPVPGPTEKLSATGAACEANMQAPWASRQHRFGLAPAASVGTAARLARNQALEA